MTSKKETTAKKSPAKSAKAAVKRVAKPVEAEIPMEADVVVPPKGEYIYAIGRRKTAVAQTRLWTGGEGQVTVNDREMKAYFPVFEMRESVIAPLKAVGQDDKVTISLKVRGGGLRGQAEAARHGISRALIELNPTFRKSLKRLGFLTRDPREKERKKYGLKKARRAPQWAKR